jgi:1-deoxy-D-xylulose-5-phosphate synthase
VTFGAGLASAGMKPFIALYSSFSQRAYDQIVHDVSMQNLPIVFCIDRAGIVGEDGETHQGVFDVSFLNHIPNMTIMAPKDGTELKKMIHYSAVYEHGPIALRYPKGATCLLTDNDFTPIEYGKSEIIMEGSDIAVISVGNMFKEGLAVCHQLRQENYQPTLVNARFIKPFDQEMIEDLSKKHQVIFILEENLVIGGYGSEVVRYVHENKLKVNVHIMGIPDTYIAHGKREELLHGILLDQEGIYNRIMEVIR